MSGGQARSPSFGVFYQGWATGERSDAEVFSDIVRSTVFADQLGYDVAWFTEQHSHIFGATWSRIAMPQLLIAHIAARTERIGLGTAVRLIADEKVSRVAEELLTLDLLTEGRVQFGIGTGMSRHPSDLGAREAQRDRMRAQTIALARILRGQTEEAREEMVLSVRDLSDRIHIASADPRSIAVAAKEGFGYFAGMFGGSRHAELTRTFRDLGGRGTTRAARLIFVAEDDRAARLTIGSAASYFWEHFTPPSPQWRQNVMDNEPLRDLDDICTQLGWIVGGPASVSQRLADYLLTCDLDGLDLSFHVPGLDASTADRSMELFATAVRPEVVRVVNAARCRKSPIVRPTELELGLS